MDLSAHLRDVALVLADLEKNGITAKPSKSFFAMQRLRVIGLIVSKLGIQVNPDRLQAITEFQMPKNKTAVRRLLGMAFSDIIFGMCWCLMSWVQQVHNAAAVARSLGCQCDTEMPTGRTLTET